MKYLLLAIALFASTCSAEDFSLILGGFSYHTSAEQRAVLNQEHQAIGIQYKDFELTYIANNSFENESIYAAYTKELVSSKHFDFNAVFGAATGYHEIESYKGWKFTNSFVMGDLMPLAGVQLETKLSKHFSIDTTFLISVTTFNLKYNF